MLRHVYPDAIISKMEVVLAVYRKPINPRETVVCPNEKSVSLHSDVRVPIPVRPSEAAERYNDEALLCPLRLWCLA